MQFVKRKGNEWRNNTARPVAIAAMVILGISLAAFWIILAALISIKPINKRLMQVSAVVSMALGVFIFSGYHDVLINIACGISLISIAGTIIGIYRQRWYRLAWLGVFLLMLLGLNNLFFYTVNLLPYLLVLQKITFAFVITWIALVNLQLYKLSSHRRQA